ncbi:MAG: hypothetical protein ACOC56_02145 [Atribacterota bacterium]
MNNTNNNIVNNGWRTKYVILTILLMIFTFSAGYALAPREVHTEQSVQLDSEYAQVVEVAKGLSEGDSVVIEIEEGTTPEYKYENQGSKQIAIKSDKWYGRFVSWFGLGGPEAAAKDQGFDIKSGGEEAEFAQQKGYGLLEQLWSKIKSLFWGFGFILLILGILTFVPVVGPIAAGILRFLASLIPMFGSLIERVIGYFRSDRPLKQTVKGVQEYKNKLTEKEKEKLKDELIKAHDESSQRTIKKIKKTI